MLEIKTYRSTPRNQSHNLGLVGIQYQRIEDRFPSSRQQCFQTTITDQNQILEIYLAIH